MRADRDFTNIRPNEVRDIAFDYKGGLFPLSPDEVLVSAEFALTVFKTSGDFAADTDPQSRIVGDPSIVANEEGEAAMAAVVRVGPCIEGNHYLVTCLATTSRGQKLQLEATMACRSHD